MGTENGNGVRGDFGQIFDEMRSFGFQTLDYMLVVYNFVAHVDWRAVFLQRTLDDLDRPNDARAESSWLS
jgi:hypothetical protein